ncbi:hypothetical protein [Microbulbifer litoralis]|uniref:hypothetical protein n=1 Tax=Microbulbifer litoralis TaxID=2933965 RepID=UPI002028F124|nr:hypothetical protein [Microbulbifer sp. GX H0434]
MNKRKARVVIISLYGSCLIACLAEVLAIFNGWGNLSGFRAVWTVVFFLLFWHWIYYESDSQEFDRPYNFGLSINTFWFIYVPWYFISTRGGKGVLTMLGFLLLFWLPFIVGLFR